GVGSVIGSVLGEGSSSVDFSSSAFPFVTSSTFILSPIVSLLSGVSTTVTSSSEAFASRKNLDCSRKKEYKSNNTIKPNNAMILIMLPFLTFFSLAILHTFFAVIFFNIYDVNVAETFQKDYDIFYKLYRQAL